MLFIKNLKCVVDKRQLILIFFELGLLKSLFWHMQLESLKRKFKVFKELVISGVSGFSFLSYRDNSKRQKQRKI